jgi:hypothetical protein
MMMKRRLTPTILGALITIVGIAACVSIDDPAPFIQREGGAGLTTPPTPYERCRVLDRRFVTDVKARVYGAAPNPQAVCVSLDVAVPAAGPGTVVFCVAGANLGSVVVPRVQSVSSNIENCAYCTYVQTNCGATDGGTSCTTAYSVVTGSARILRLNEAVGESVWIDLGNLEVARVIDPANNAAGLESRDCLFADGLTLQGVLTAGSTSNCFGVDEPICRIASTAASRSP